jgi:2-haloacid dehalogenase
MTAARPNVVFDLGGVLIDWDPRHLYRGLFADPSAMEEFLATVCTQHWNERQDAGRRIAEAEAELIERHPDKAALIRAYYGQFDRMLAGPIHDAVAVLEALDAQGTPLYALSNWSAETFAHARRRFGFLARFRGIVISGEIGMIKPDPRVYRHLLETYRLRAADCVFIDDNPANVTGACEAGLQAIHFRGPQPLREALGRYGLAV